ncbi:hypothetical protein PGT21_014509 [Puccinia graminis f. sp. tritici]|uniref:Uncharacterized protein n=1 Tax=Puccinia graminis f. sp. tritici TaxID=56615 RepID=A0A5B0NFY7_PUCGR|nr:hypothetical protein PGT21_014509 [Puccinia graminis f. sp. tritici]
MKQSMSERTTSQYDGITTITVLEVKTASTLAHCLTAGVVRCTPFSLINTLHQAVMTLSGVNSPSRTPPGFMIEASTIPVSFLPIPSTSTSPRSSSHDTLAFTNITQIQICKYHPVKQRRTSGKKEQPIETKATWPSNIHWIFEEQSIWTDPWLRKKPRHPHRLYISIHFVRNMTFMGTRANGTSHTFVFSLMYLCTLLHSQHPSLSFGVHPIVLRVKFYDV